METITISGVPAEWRAVLERLAAERGMGLEEFLRDHIEELVREASREVALQRVRERKQRAPRRFDPERIVHWLETERRR